MTNLKTALLAAAFIAPVALVAGSAQAQAVSVAVADAPSAIGNAKALAAANQQIEATYKPQLDQASARNVALRKEIEPLLTALDTNKDGQVSDAELEAAKAAKRPEIARIETAQKTANAQIAQLTTPAILAQAYALESITMKYGAALEAVTTSRKIGLVVSPESVVFSAPAADITTAVTAEIDRALPTTSITVPAGWRPSRQTVQLQQQLQQMQQAAAQRAQAQAPQAAAPAAGGKPATSGR